MPAEAEVEAAAREEGTGAGPRPRFRRVGLRLRDAADRSRAVPRGLRHVLRPDAGSGAQEAGAVHEDAVRRRVRRGVQDGGPDGEVHGGRRREAQAPQVAQACFGPQVEGPVILILRGDDSDSEKVMVRETQPRVQIAEQSWHVS